jgi:hypothetical protein
MSCNIILILLDKKHKTVTRAFDFPMEVNAKQADAGGRGTISQRIG